MIVRYKLDWSVEDLIEYSDVRKVTFDNVIQRGFVWDKARKSLFIHSILSNYPVPELWMNEKEDVFDVLDGKQRFDALNGFINNKYSLSSVPELVMKDGTTININGLKFEDFEKEISAFGDRYKHLSNPVDFKKLRNNLLRYKLDIHCFKNLEEKQMRDIFFRLNNGKPLSAVDITKGRAKSLDRIMEITEHPVFEVMFNDKTKNSSISVDIIMKAFIILFEESKPLQNRKIRYIMEKKEFSDDNVNVINSCFQTFLNAYEFINLSSDNTEISQKQKEMNQKVMKRIVTKTHFVTLLPITRYVFENNIPIEDFAKWMVSFFGSISGATISDEYNQNATTGSASLSAVTTRLNIINKSFMDYINK